MFGLKIFKSVPIGNNSKLNISKSGLGGSIKTPLGRITQTANGQRYITKKVLGATVKIPI